MRRRSHAPRSPRTICCRACSARPSTFLAALSFRFAFLRFAPKEGAALFCFAFAFCSRRGGGEDEDDAGDRRSTIAGNIGSALSFESRNETKARRGTATDGTAASSAFCGNDANATAARGRGRDPLLGGIRNSDPPPSENRGDETERDGVVGRRGGGRGRKESASKRSSRGRRPEERAKRDGRRPEASPLRRHHRSPFTVTTHDAFC